MKELAVLYDAMSHSTSEGFAVSYLGAGVRPLIATDAGVVFNAGFGRRRVTYVCARPMLPTEDHNATRILTPTAMAVATGWTVTKRKEYVLRSLDVSHMTRKERYNETVHPVRALAKQGYALRWLLPSDMPKVERLWKVWCETKLADPKVHRSSFPAARYLRCVQDALKGLYPHAAYVLASESGVAAVRVLSLTAARAFDLAFFSDRAVKESARAMQWLSLQDLFERNIREVNFGNSTGKGLSYFKTRFNAVTIDSFQYDKPASENPGLFDVLPPDYQKQKITPC